jgi:hypothetical protein
MGGVLRLLGHHVGRRALEAGGGGWKRDRRPQSGRDLSQTAIWAGIVAASATIPAQIHQWHELDVA